MDNRYQVWPYAEIEKGVWSLPDEALSNIWVDLVVSGRAARTSASNGSNGESGQTLQKILRIFVSPQPARRQRVAAGFPRKKAWLESTILNHEPPFALLMHRDC